MDNGKECPVCGKEKQKLKHLVCRECFGLYTNDASDALAERSEVVFMAAWVAEKIAARIPILELKLKLARENYCSLQGKTKEEAISFIRKSPGGGKKLPAEVLREALKKKGKDLWHEHGGNKLHYEVMSLVDKIDSLNNLLKELEVKREKKTEAAEAEMSVVV